MFFFVGSTFHFGFIITLKTLLFPEIYLGIQAKPRQTHNGLVLCPPMDQIHRTLIGRWSQACEICMRTCLFSIRRPKWCKMCKQAKKKKKDQREKLVVFMTGYSRLVTESVSLRPGLTWMTHRVSRPFARLLCRPHVLQMRWNKLRDGFYRQNPAYFPQIYPWIHDKCSSTSFKLYLWARFSDFLILPLQCFLWCLFFDNTGKNFGQVIY